MTTSDPRPFPVDGLPGLMQAGLPVVYLGARGVIAHPHDHRPHFVWTVRHDDLPAGPTSPHDVAVDHTTEAGLAALRAALARAVGLDPDQGALWRMVEINDDGSAWWRLEGWTGSKVFHVASQEHRLALLLACWAVREGGERD